MTDPTPDAVGPRPRRLPPQFYAPHEYVWIWPEGEPYLPARFTRSALDDLLWRNAILDSLGPHEFLYVLTDEVRP